MAYRTYAPNPQLSALVEKISIEEDWQEPSGTITPTRIIPTGTIDLLFHYGDPFAQVIGESSVTKPYAYVAGQRTRSFEVTATGKMGIVIVSLKPWGFAGLTNMKLAETTDQFVDMTALVPEQQVLSLIDALRNEADPETKVSLVQDFLETQLTCRRDDLVLQALRQLYQGSGDICRLCQQLGISKRQLDRRFANHIGLTAKKLQTIIRFQRSLAHLDSDLCQTAHEAGYFDQSHMIRDYQRFTDKTPGYVLSRTAATPLMAFYARPANMSHFYNRLHLQ